MSFGSRGLLTDLNSFIQIDKTFNETDFISPVSIVGEINMQGLTNSRRLILVFSILLFPVMVFVSGCGKSQDTGKSTVTLVVFGDTKHWKPLTDSFMKKTPGIDVRLLGFPGEGYYEKISAMYAGGTPPDVLWINTKAAEFASRGLLLDLTPYVERDKEEMVLSDIYPQLLEACKYKGRYYWFPVNVNADIMFYNKTLFDEAKVPYLDENTTYDDFVDIAKKLTRDTDGDGRIDQYGVWVYKVADWILGHVLRWGGDVFDSEVSRCLIDSPENIEAIQWYVDLLKTHKVVPSAATLESQSDISMFMSGRLGMFHCGWYVSSLFKKGKALDWDVAPVPKHPGRPRITYGGMNYFLISKTTKAPEAAWALVKHVTSVEGQTYFMENGFDMAVRKQVTERMSEIVTFPEHRQVVADAIQSCRLIPEFPLRSEAMEIFKQEFDNIYYKDTPVAKACKRAAERVNKLLGNEAGKNSIAND